MSAATVDNKTNGTMDSNLLNFLREKVNTFTKWDLVRFFHDNPHAEEIAPNIARFIGRDLTEVKHELTNLVSSQVLEMRSVSGVQVYRMVDDAATRGLIAEFVSACDDPEFRVQAIHEVIENSQ
jgi:hypothetical protein